MASLTRNGTSRRFNAFLTPTFRRCTTLAMFRQSRHWQPSSVTTAAILLCVVLPSGQPATAEDLPMTRNVPMWEFQNRQTDTKPYDFDAPPEGMFRSITTAEGFEEELGFRRTHEIVPISPTEEFGPTTPVFIVFQLHQHYQSFKVFGQCFPEDVPGLDPKTMIGQDAMYIALEDETGYLKLSPPGERWQPGRYKVEIHAGEQPNETTLVGTMRFTIAQRR